MRRRMLAAAVLAVALSGCGGGTSDTGAVESPEMTEHAMTGPSLTAADQTSDGKSVKVASVTSVGPGFIALHSDLNGPGPVVGHAAVKEGKSTDVVVNADAPPLKSGKYWPMLHVDKGVVGTYEFPGADLPANADGQTVMKMITVTVA